MAFCLAPPVSAICLPLPSFCLCVRLSGQSACPSALLPGHLAAGLPLVYSLATPLYGLTFGLSILAIGIGRQLDLLSLGEKAARHVGRR